MFFSFFFYKAIMNDRVSPLSNKKKKIELKKGQTIDLKNAGSVPSYQDSYTKILFYYDLFC